MSMVRVSESAHRSLKEMAASRGISIQSILDNAVEEYRRKEFLEKLNSDFAELRADPVAWQGEAEERKIWEQAISDGLEDR